MGNICLKIEEKSTMMSLISVNSKLYPTGAFFAHFPLAEQFFKFPDELKNKRDHAGMEDLQCLNG